MSDLCQGNKFRDLTLQGVDHMLLGVCHNSKRPWNGCDISAFNYLASIVEQSRHGRAGEFGIQNNNRIGGLYKEINWLEKEHRWELLKLRR